ncbi:hypothetical protein M0R04_06625 [Candidatus Dojkabacteria bacterium]|jgi:hypothetical protein|nr:hypothetical protein [Candidatus Dojkabacteria bacterium]
MKSWTKGLCKMQSSNFELDVLVHGSSARTYQHEGRVFIEGKEGSEFTIRIKNNTHRRVLAVLTVDGLSVIDGKEGSFTSGGYIIDPFGSVKVPGWRLNNEEVASFEFTSPNKAYASKQGSGGNLGVIGCALYYEEYKSLPWSTVTTTDNDRFYTLNPSLRDVDTSPSMYMNASQSSSNTSLRLDSVQNSLGTKFGDKAVHKIRDEFFQRSTKVPIEILTIYYDSKQGLKERGIDLEWRPTISPSAFPKEDIKFCQPPKDWK